jgi:hypothetical protein
MADQPTVNPTPRQEFQANGSYVKLHREMMQQPMLGVSLHYALLHYQRLMTGPMLKDDISDPPAARFYKLQGAQEFMDILLKLGEMPPAEKARNRTDQIKHNV